MRAPRTLLTYAPVLWGALVLAAGPGDARSQPVSYTLDRDHSQPVFEVSHLGISTYRGKFTAVAGKVMLDAGAGTGSIDATVRVDSVLTGSRQLDGVLAGEDFFDADRFPELRFLSSAVTLENGMPVRAEGELTMRGVTRPATLRIHAFRCAKHSIMVWREVCGAEATLTLRRSEYGMTRYLNSVGDEIRVLLSVEGFRD